MTIEEILSELRVPYLSSGHHHCRPGWVQVQNCPFCGSDKYHLGFNTSKKFFMCWKCGFHHADTVLKAFGAALGAAKALVRDLDTTFAPKEQGGLAALQEPAGLGPLLPAHMRYLRERGFDPAELERVWGIKGIGIAHKLQWRIYIPVTRKGVTVTWTTRSIAPGATQRYISASSTQEARNIKHCVYGREFCRHSIIIVEGPTDAWAVGPGAGALFGTAFLTPQVAELVGIPRRIVCFDSAPEAQRRAENLAAQLACFPGVTENVVLDAKDPGSASAKELRLLRKTARF